MNDELRDARHTVFEQLRDTEYSPWLFEYTPAGEEDAKDAYLRKVAECDVFVWITKGETTTPVAAEVREALRAGKDVLAFRLPHPAPDSLTSELVSAVRKRHKTQDVADASELIRALEAALRDLASRKIRAAPPMGLTQTLDLLYRRSVARCYVRFMAAGLDEAKARELAEDPGIGAQPEVLAKISGVLIVCDQVGAGKSIAADRAHQAAINSAHGGGPVPVWIPARNVACGLESAVHAAGKHVGDPARLGAHIVVDGVDESEIDPWGLLDESRELATAWPKTTVIITSRPVAGLQGAPERVQLPPLADGEVLALAAMAGEAPFSVFGLAPALRDAVRRPLFALLLGGAGPGAGIAAPHELVALLVDRALARKPSEARTEQALIHLAVLSTERNGPVPIAEVPDAVIVVRTGLVQSDGQALTFGLAVVEHWFAARSLGTDVAIDDIAGDFPRLARWRYPLAVAVAVGSYDRITELLIPVAELAPATLAWLIDEAIASGLSDTVAPLPPTSKAGGQLRSAMSAFAKALGPLAPSATPADARCVLPPLGIVALGNELTTSWWEGQEAPASPVVDLSAAPDLPGWRHVRSGWNAGRPGWAWRYGLDCIRDLLAASLEQRALTTPPVLQKERDWALANALLERGIHGNEAIDAREVSAAVSRVCAAVPGEALIKVGPVGPTVWLSDLVALVQRTLALDATGVIVPPWPGPDGPRSGWI